MSRLSLEAVSRVVVVLAFFLPILTKTFLERNTADIENINLTRSFVRKVKENIKTKLSKVGKYP